jgi:hypothetical protein
LRVRLLPALVRLPPALVRLLPALPVVRWPLALGVVRLPQASPL